MLYNLSNTLDKERFKRRSNELYQKGSIVELSEKNRRSLSQNSYIHLIIGYLAIETGNTIEYVKREYFKRGCNRELFVTTKHDNLLKTQTEVLRSSADLSKEEMAIAIDRFRNWSAQNGVYLPDALEQQFLIEIQIEIDKNKQYL